MDAPTSRLTITIDGPAGAGKSTTAKLLASRLGYQYLDTGALYRAVAWFVITKGVEPSDVTQITALLTSMNLQICSTEKELRVSVYSQDVTEHLRSPEISQGASSVAAIPEVRDWLLPYQQEFGSQSGIVAEGRDMGTRVFPTADVKFFLDADIETRTRRRYQDGLQAGHRLSRENVQKEVMNRDARDRSRAIAPLKPAPDAVVIDSSSLTAAQIVEKMLELIPTQS